jgi:hypothetical protein
MNKPTPNWVIAYAKKRSMKPLTPKNFRAIRAKEESNARKPKLTLKRGVTHMLMNNFLENNVTHKSNKQRKNRRSARKSKKNTRRR